MNIIYQKFNDSLIKINSEFDVKKILEDLCKKVNTLQKTFEELQKGSFKNSLDTYAFCGQLQAEMKKIKENFIGNWDSIKDFSSQQKVVFLGMDNSEIMPHINNLFNEVFEQKENVYLQENNVDILKKLLWLVFLLVNNIELSIKEKTFEKGANQF